MPELTLSISRDIDKRLEEISDRMGITKAETVKKAFALLSVAEQQKNLGNSLGIIREDPVSHSQKVLSEIVGL